MQIADTADDEAVRIFLEFDRLESAIKGIAMSVVICGVISYVVVSCCPRISFSFANIPTVTALGIFLHYCRLRYLLSIVYHVDLVEYVMQCCLR